jgi:NAD kinase
MNIEHAIVVVNKTRLESLIERFNTKAQAKFYIEHSGGDFKDYELEHDTFHASLDSVTEFFTRELKVKVIEREFVPNFLFSEKDLVVVVGQDGLVANTAKYVNGLPILAINPDVNRFDGVLLPYTISDFEVGFTEVIKRRAVVKEITLAEARTNDGQKLLAFNDLFIGPASHTSARYKITYNQVMEQQSSSGIIVATGAGSTGWLSSVMNMANGVSQTFNNGRNSRVNFSLPWNTDKLAFVVREPFRSKYSDTNLSAGLINNTDKLRIESQMPSNGIVFSDGVEADFLHFNSGTKLEVGVADQKARLIVKQKKR